MAIRLNDKLKYDLAKILRRSGKITAMIAVHMARPNTKMLDCIRYVREFETSKYYTTYMQNCERAV